MISLGQFKASDIQAVCCRIYPGMVEEQAAALIREWSTCRYEGKLFLMLGIWVDEEPVGTVSLLENESGTVSFGIEISPAFRRRGYGYAAGLLAREKARVLGYRYMISQVRQANKASIGLHEKLGFQMSGVSVNRKGNPVYEFQLPLQ